MLLLEVTEAFINRQKLMPQPYRFRVCILEDEIIFNHKVAIELPWLGSKPVLHVVFTRTHFSNAIWIKSKWASDIWLAFLDCGSPL